MEKLNQALFNNLINGVIENCPREILTNENILAWSENGIINENCIAHLSSYLINHGFVFGPYEIHPYILREINNFNLERKYLLCGTFPPNSYLHNIPILNPLAIANPNVGNPPQLDFYYGNLIKLWRLFNIPIPINYASVSDFLDENSISISDTILGAQRAIFRDASDIQYNNIVLNFHLLNILNLESKIETLLFTSGSLKNIHLNLNGNKLNALNSFLKIFSNENLDLKISGQVNGLGNFMPLNTLNRNAEVIIQNNQIIWWLEIAGRKFRIINLPTPATSQGMMSSPFFLRWANWKLVSNGLAPINQNIRTMDQLQALPAIFDPTPTNQYRKEIYDMAIHNIPLLETI